MMLSVILSTSIPSKSGAAAQMDLLIGQGVAENFKHCADAFFSFISHVGNPEGFALDFPISAIDDQ